MERIIQALSSNLHAEMRIVAKTMKLLLWKMEVVEWAEDWTMLLKHLVLAGF